MAKKHLHYKDEIRFSIGITEEVIHNSIVIVDNRLLITIYSHLYEMGDKGITIDIDLLRDAERELCLFFEQEFLRLWQRSRPILDHRRPPVYVESRILRYQETIGKITEWFNDLGRVPPPPHLVVVFPTYRCAYGHRSLHVESNSIVPEGPYKDKLLCANCMFGPVLNNKGMSDMPVNSFSRLCKELIEIGVNQIELSGGGEPLHHKNAQELIGTIQSLRSSQSQEVKFGLISNIAALAECDFINDLIRSFSYIRWSWPEDAEVSSALRQGYLEYLKRFVERKLDLQRQDQSSGNVRIGVKILATKDNVSGDRPSIVSMVAELLNIGVDHIKIRAIRSRTTSAHKDDLRRAADALLRLELQLVRSGVLSGDKTLEVDLHERYVQPSYKCQLSSMISVIEPNGNVRMCWNDVAPNDDRVIGNAFQSLFHELWVSERHREICRKMKAEWVCNSEDGCHCRIVGYQEAADRLSLSHWPHTSASDALGDGDGFL